MISQLNRVHPAWAALAVLIGVTSGALGNTNGKNTPQVKQGMSGHGLFYREGSWTQTSPEIENPTNSEQEFRVELPRKDFQRGKLIHWRSVTVPARAQRKLNLGVWQGFLADPTKRNSQIGKRVEIHSLLFHAGKKLDDDFGNSTVLPRGTSLLSFMGELFEPKDSRAFLTDDDPKSTSPFRKSKTTALSMRSAPTRWYGHDSVDMVFLNGPQLENYRPSQVQALLDWVKRGGILVIVSSQNLPDTLASRFGEIAGVSLIDIHRVSMLDIRDENNQVAAAIRLPHPLPMSELCVESADVIYRANGLPLLTRQMLGDGQVFTLACPVGALQGHGGNTILSKLESATRYKAAIDASKFDPNKLLHKRTPNPARQTLQEIAGRPSVAQWVPAAIICGTAVLGGLVWLSKSRSKKGELAWVILVPACILLTVGLTVYSRRQADPERLSFIGLVTGIDDTSARVQTRVAYYPGPKSVTKTFSADSSRGIIMDAGKSSTSAIGTAYIQTSQNVGIPELRVAEGETIGLYTDAVIDQSGISGKLSFGPKGLTGIIKNNLPHDVNDAVIYFHRHVFPLGTIKAGESIDMADKAMSITEKGDFIAATYRLRNRGDILRNDLLKQLTDDSLTSISDDSRPTLIGYIENLPVAPLSDMPLHKGWCLVTWPLQMESPAQGSSITIPAGWTDVSFSRRSRSRILKSGFNATRIPLYVRPCPPVETMQDTTLKLTIDARALLFKLSVMGIPSRATSERGRGELIKEYSNPDGKLELTIPNANRFRDSNGVYRLQIRISKTKSPITLAEDATRTWNIKRVDVSLEGKTR